MKSDDGSEALRTVARIKHYIRICLKISKSLWHNGNVGVTFYSAQSSLVVFVYLSLTPTHRRDDLILLVNNPGLRGTTGSRVTDGVWRGCSALKSLKRHIYIFKIFSMLIYFRETKKERERENEPAREGQREEDIESETGPTF